MTLVFIDGSSGTTGLRIHDRLRNRPGVDLVTLPEEDRKNPKARAEAINSADIAVLCLPDAAAREAVSFVRNPATVVLDASTAHRTAPGWAYGFPELGPSYLEGVRTSKRIAVPGCHASGFIALVSPLTEAGVVSREAKLTCTSLTGYSGGGKKMIADYEAGDRSPLFDSPRVYALGQTHKHLPEMKVHGGGSEAPAFLPIVGDFYSGMLVIVPIFRKDLAAGTTIETIRGIYREKYRSPIVSYVDGMDEDGFLAASALSGLDCMQVSVFGNEDRILLAARYDNLGKGASGAALECFNIATGAAPETGLNL